MNYHQVNYLMDVVMPAVKPATFKIVSAVARQTWGWERAEIQLSFSQLEKMTGMSINTIKTAILDASDYIDAVALPKEQGYIYRMKDASTMSTIDIVETGTISEVDGVLCQELTGTMSEIDTPSYIERKKKKEERTPPTPQTDDPDLQTIWDEIQVTIAHFEKLTGIKRPYGQSEKAKTRMSEDWVTPVHDMKALANGRTEELMRRAVEEMTRDKLTIGSPRSINTTFCRLHREAAQKTADNPHADMKSNGKGW